jgi:hypothetical protein
MARERAAAAGPKVGDWIEARGVHGQPSRRGEITELLGGGEHARYRVRWDEKHESIVYPADGVVIVSRRQHARQSQTADSRYPGVRH